MPGKRGKDDWAGRDGPRGAPSGLPFVKSHIVGQRQKIAQRFTAGKAHDENPFHSAEGLRAGSAAIEAQIENPIRVLRAKARLPLVFASMGYPLSPTSAVFFVNG